MKGPDAHTFRMLALFAVLALGATGIILAFSYRAELTATRRALYQQCQDRLRYDDAAAAERVADTALLTANISRLRDEIEQERTNRFIDDTLRAKRVTSKMEQIVALQRNIEAKRAALAAEPRKGCPAFH